MDCKVQLTASTIEETLCFHKKKKKKKKKKKDFLHCYSVRFLQVFVLIVAQLSSKLNLLHCDDSR